MKYNKYVRELYLIKKQVEFLESIINFSKDSISIPVDVNTNKIKQGEWQEANIHDVTYYPFKRLRYYRY